MWNCKHILCLSFYVSVGYQNSGPHPCIANTFTHWAISPISFIWLYCLEGKNPNSIAQPNQVSILSCHQSMSSHLDPTGEGYVWFTSLPASQNALSWSTSYLYLGWATLSSLFICFQDNSEVTFPRWLERCCHFLMNYLVSDSGTTTLWHYSCLHNLP